MNFQTILILTLSLFLNPIISESEVNDVGQFFENLTEFCGDSYYGEVVYPDTPPDGFEGQLIAHFNDCGDDYMNIPFHVGENESRTWMLTKSHNSILFKHDHRYPDGTPEELTNYGGWNDGRGSDLIQFFPADNETIAMRDGLRSHIWVMEISEDHSTFSYSLYLYNDLYFQADFDLTNPI